MRMTTARTSLDLQWCSQPHPPGRLYFTVRRAAVIACHADGVPSGAALTVHTDRHVAQRAARLSVDVHAVASSRRPAQPGRALGRALARVAAAPQRRAGERGRRARAADAPMKRSALGYS